MRVKFAIRSDAWRKIFAKGLAWVFLAMPGIAISNDQPLVRPSLQAQKLDGSRYELSDSHGSLTVVVIWSPDSLASRKSLGELERFMARHQTPEISVIAVSTLDDVAKLRDFAKERQLAFPLAVLVQSNLGPFADPGLPYVLVFDRDGLLQGAHSGLFRLQTLEKLVAPFN